MGSFYVNIFQCPTLPEFCTIFSDILGVPQPCLAGRHTSLCWLPGLRKVKLAQLAASVPREDSCPLQTMTVSNLTQTIFQQMTHRTFPWGTCKIRGLELKGFFANITSGDVILSEKWFLHSNFYLLIIYWREISCKDTLCSTFIIKS